MKISIINKEKRELLIGLFQIIKNSTNLCNLIFEDEHIHIQGMDKSHICLFDIIIKNKWFDFFQINNNDIMKICFDSDIFYSIISNKSNDNELLIHFNDESDFLHIDLKVKESTKKTDVNKYFKIPLLEYEYEELSLPSVDYDAEFTVSSKQIYDITSQMLQFGTDILLLCSEDTINLKSTSTTGEMLVNISIEDLEEYSITEGEKLELLYSLNYIHKTCLTNKLSNNIRFSLSKEYPMKIEYNLGDDSSLLFYIAPKISN